MSDVRQAELRRRAAVDGTPEARAAVLRARARAGERSGLACECGVVRRWIEEAGIGDPGCAECNGTGRRPLAAGIELAAYCGDEAALLVLGWERGGNGRVYKPSGEHGTGWSGWPDWGTPWLPLAVLLGGDGTGFRGLGQWGHEALVRAQHAIADLHNKTGCNTQMSRTPWNMEAERMPAILHECANMRCTEEIGEPAVRAAICRALVPWALGEA